MSIIILFSTIAWVGFGWMQKKIIKMEIVDAHMHLWSPDTHPWVANAKDGGHPAGKFGE